MRQPSYPRRPATHGATTSSLQFGPFHATEAAYRPSLYVSRHTHIRSGFTLTLTGSYVERFRRHEEVANAGSVLVKPAESLHSNRYGPSGCRCFLIGIDHDYLASQRRLASAINAVSLHKRGAVPHIMRRMYTEFAARHAACGLLLEGLALELAAMVLRSIERAPRMPPPWLNMVRELLHSAVSTPAPTLSELATAAGVHPGHVSRAFRAAFGSTPGQYLRQVRIEHAQRLLAESEMPLSQLAVAAGFYDQSHFTTAFLRETGTTPARYRARYNSAESAKVQPFQSEVKDFQDFSE